MLEFPPRIPWGPQNLKMTKKVTFTPDLIRGFTDAEGCFNVHISKNQTMALGEQLQLRFIVDQNVVDKQLLEDIGTYFGGGKANPYGKQSCQVVMCRQDVIIKSRTIF